MAEVIVESPEVRRKRFETAKSNRQNWDSLYEQAYHFSAPHREILFNPGVETSSTRSIIPGQDRMKDIFDMTAIKSVEAFASNYMSSIMPPFQRWASLEPAEDLKTLPQPFIDVFGSFSDQSIDDLKEQLEKITETLFKFFERSNLYQATFQALQDFAVGTGALLINQGDFEDPLIFKAVNGAALVIEHDSKERPSNVWRSFSMMGRNIKLLWPNAQLNGQLATRINSNPDERINLIESTLFYENNPRDKQWYYSVMVEDSNTEIVSEFRDMSPWIVFRFDVSPQEVYGRGPVITALPTIRELNKIHEFVLRGAQLQAFPVFMGISSASINPYNIKIVPGAVLAFDRNDFLQGDPIRPLSTGNGVQIGQQFIQFLQEIVKDILFANPLPPQSAPSQTATEITFRQQEWIQRNAGAFNRTAVELQPKIIMKSLKILTDLGLIPKLNINGKLFSVFEASRLLKFTFESPLIQIQKSNDLQAIQQGVTWALQTFGGLEGLTTFNIGNLPEEVYELLGIPQSLINKGFKDSPLIQQILQAVNQGPQGAQPGVAPNLAASQISPSPIGTTPPTSLSAASALPIGVQAQQ